MISKGIHKGEKILKTLKPSRWAYFRGHFFGVLLLIAGLIAIAMFAGIVNFIGIVVVVLAIIILIINEMIRKANTFYITNERLIHEFAFLSRKISSTTYDRIQDLHIIQSITDRIVGIGTIHINTAGTHFIEIKFFNISKPVAIKRFIEGKLIKKSRY